MDFVRHQFVSPLIQAVIRLEKLMTDKEIDEQFSISRLNNFVKNTNRPITNITARLRTSLRLVNPCRSCKAEYASGTKLEFSSIKH